MSGKLEVGSVQLAGFSGEFDEVEIEVEVETERFLLRWKLGFGSWVLGVGCSRMRC